MGKIAAMLPIKSGALFLKNDHQIESADD